MAEGGADGSGAPADGGAAPAAKRARFSAQALEQYKCPASEAFTW